MMMLMMMMMMMMMLMLMMLKIQPPTNINIKTMILYPNYLNKCLPSWISAHIVIIFFGILFNQ